MYLGAFGYRINYAAYHLVRSLNGINNGEEAAEKKSNNRMNIQTIQRRIELCHHV
jgi:hypothetical protein